MKVSVHRAGVRRGGTPVTERPPRRSWPTRRFPMKRSVTYTVVVTRHPRYYVARCPALPSCVTFHKSRARAYTEVKHLVRDRVTGFVADGSPLPPDPIVSVKHLRLNLTEIREEVDLR